MKIKIGEKVYEASAVDAVTLKDTMLLEAELAQHGIARSWVDITNSLRAMQAMGRKEAMNHPDWLLATCLTVWATRRAAGEQVGFLDAIDVPVDQIQFIPVEDHKPVKAGGDGGKARSAQAAAHRSRKR